MDKNKIGVFANKVYGDMAGAMAVGMAYLGVKCGLFKTMNAKGPMSKSEVVQASGLQARYVDEWLKGMTAAGYLDYDKSAETYSLSEEHAYLLCSEGTDHFMGGLFYFAPALLSVAPRVAEAFKSGGGVPFDAFGPECLLAIDMINAGMYEQRFANYWLAKMPDVHARLAAGGRVLDMGCGVGRVGIAIAKAFPKCEVVGVDLDKRSIAEAETKARAAGVEGRARYVASPVASLPREQPFDLITACDCVHDFSTPEKTLREIRALLKPDGALFVVEPKAADKLEDNCHPIGAMFYGFSIFHCMTQSLANNGPGLGTAMGPKKTEEVLRAAGFGRFEALDIRSQTNVFYAARP